MVRPPNSVAERLARFVCVRVTDMRHVDLDRYRFDYDLTFAAMTLHADGTVYHRYGGRPPHDAEGWLSMNSFAYVLDASLAAHAKHEARDIESSEPRTIADFPPFAEKLRSRRIDCVHCHNVHDARTATLRAADRFQPHDRWVWPDPLRIGLEFDPDDQPLVARVVDDSPAHAAGLRAGDRVARIGDRAIASITDVQDVLDRAPHTAHAIDVTFARDGDEPTPRTTTIEVADGWKTTPAREYAWRPFKWGLSPAPGFGGDALGPERKRELGIDPKSFAFAVTYFVDWGDHGHRGGVVKRAGLRKQDVVVAIDGRSDFASIDHFHAWVRLAKRVGDPLRVAFLRGGERREITFALPR